MSTATRTCLHCDAVVVQRATGEQGRRTWVHQDTGQVNGGARTYAHIATPAALTYRRGR